MIGDQTTLHLSATTSQNEHVLFPNLEKAIGQEMTVVERTNIDTIQEKDGRTTYRQDLVLTSFKDTLLATILGGQWYHPFQLTQR